LRMRDRPSVAKMTSTYERIRSESLYYRAHQRCEFIIEFKDERNAPPPFNLFPYSCLPGFHRNRMRSRGFSVLMGRYSARKLQSRERMFALAFDDERVRKSTKQTDVRIAAVHDEILPAVRTMVQRVDDEVRSVDEKTQRIDEKVDGLTRTVEAMASMVANLQASQKPMSGTPHVQQAQGYGEAPASAVPQYRTSTTNGDGPFDVSSTRRPRSRSRKNLVAVSSRLSTSALHPLRDASPPPRNAVEAFYADDAARRANVATNIYQLMRGSSDLL